VTGEVIAFPQPSERPRAGLFDGSPSQAPAPAETYGGADVSAPGPQ